MEQKQEVRKYLLQDVKQAIASAQLELERIDFLWGRIRLSRLTVTPAIKADVRVEVCIAWSREVFCGYADSWSRTCRVIWWCLPMWS